MIIHTVVVATADREAAAQSVREREKVDHTLNT